MSRSDETPAVCRADVALSATGVGVWNAALRVRLPALRLRSPGVRAAPLTWASAEFPFA